MTDFEQVQEAVKYVTAICKTIPSVMILTGTGLGQLEEKINAHCSIPYTSIPGFPKTRLEGHSGNLIIGEVDGITCALFSGRFHYYEGVPAKQIIFPVRLGKFLGANDIIITNVSGGLNPSYNAGDIVFLKDHINLQVDNPLRGHNDERFGPRFPDMLNAYSPKFLAIAEEVCKDQGLPFLKGVYLGLQGPNLETPAEYVFMHKLGADMVGMSTVPEVIGAKHMGMNIMAISLISNVCYPPDKLTQTTLEQVLAIANAGGPKIVAIVESFLKKLNKIRI